MRLKYILAYFACEKFRLKLDYK